MEEAKGLSQQQQLMLQQQQQQRQLLLLQQIQQQKHHHHQQQAAISRFPSNIDAHLRPQQQQQQLRHRPVLDHPHQSQPPLLLHHQTPNPNPNDPIQHPNPLLNTSFSSNAQQQQQHQQLHHQQQQQQMSQQQQQQKSRAPPAANQAELQMAYQDAWRVCHPDYHRPFSSLEDACDRLLPYHVIADYEAEEDDRILDSDTTGQMLSRSQQWDHNIAAKVAEFTATFEKQVLAFNIISRKRGVGEFRSEERLMIEQALLQEEKRALIEARAELDSRQKAGREANLRIAAMVHAEQARGESQTRGEMMSRSQGSNMGIGHEMGEQEQVVNADEMMNGWGNNTQRDEEEPSEDFLNDEETENGDTSMQTEWRGGEELDLNTR